MFRPTWSFCFRTSSCSARTDLQIVWRESCNVPAATFDPGTIRNLKFKIYGCKKSIKWFACFFWNQLIVGINLSFKLLNDVKCCHCGCRDQMETANLPQEWREPSPGQKWSRKKMKPSYISYGTRQTNPERKGTNWAELLQKHTATAFKLVQGRWMCRMF